MAKFSSYNDPIKGFCGQEQYHSMCIRNTEGTVRQYIPLKDKGYYITYHIPTKIDNSPITDIGFTASFNRTLYSLFHIEPKEDHYIITVNKKLLN